MEMVATTKRQLIYLREHLGQKMGETGRGTEKVREGRNLRLEKDRRLYKVPGK